MRLINADELIVMEYGGIKFVPKEFIDDAPTVDAVKVIRCENCRHFDGDRFCDLIMQAGWHDNDFCSYAERRQDER